MEDLLETSKGLVTCSLVVQCAQAVSRLSRLITKIDGNLPPARIVSPTLEFLQGVGHASDNPLIKWIVSRCHTWCAAELLASASYR